MIASLTLPLLLLLAPPEARPGGSQEAQARGARAAAPAEKPAEKADAKADAKDKDAKAEKEEAPVVTKHELRVGGRVLRYSVTTGLMPLKSDTGEVEARI